LAEAAFVDAAEIAHFLTNYGDALVEAGFVLQFNQVIKTKKIINNLIN